MRCGAATLPDPTPPQVQRLRKSLHLWWSQNSFQNSAHRLYEGFFVARRPPVIQGLRKICTTPLSLRLLGNLAKGGQSPQMWSRKSPHRLYLTTFVSDDKGRLQISTLLIFDPEKPTALQGLNKSPHRLYLTTFSPIAPGPVSKTRVAPEQRAVSRAPKFRGAPIFLRLSGTAAPERHEARKGSKIPRTP